MLCLSGFELYFRCVPLTRLLFQVNYLLKSLLSVPLPIHELLLWSYEEDAKS